MKRGQIFRNIWNKLDEFSSSSPYDSSEIETCRDALATALAKLKPEDEFHSLEDAIEALPIAHGPKGQLLEVLASLDEFLEAASYDSGDDDQDDQLHNLLSDFYSIFEPELKKLENEHSKSVR